MLEDAVLEWFGALGYEVAHGPSIAPGEPAAERTDFRETILRGRLLTALRRLNPDLDGSVLQEAERQVLTATSPALLSENRRLHRLLVDGVTVEVPHATGGVRGVQVRLIDWDEPGNDDWLVVSQFAVKGASVRRPDVVVFVNGLPLAVLELKGSGKSLTMAFYAGKVIAQPAMENPTIVVLTDRNDLDDQLFGVFAAASDLIRQAPVQVEDRDHLRRLLSVPAGGVVFTTIQKFLPEPGERFPTLSERRNVVVVADEAHRSQYGFIDGFARHMRDADYETVGGQGSMLMVSASGTAVRLGAERESGRY